MATLRRQQSVASRRPVRGIVPPTSFELFRQWRFTELPVSRAERSSERRGAELPKFAVIRPVFLARLPGAARWGRFRPKIVLSPKAELFCSAVVFRAAQLRWWRLFGAEIVRSPKPELFCSAVVFRAAQLRWWWLFGAEIVRSPKPELFCSAVVFRAAQFRW